MSPLQIAAAVAAVAIAAFAIWRRRGLSGERKLIAAALVLACAVYASGVLSELPDPKEVIEDVAQKLGPWTYLLVGVMAYLETGAFVGLVAPGETVVIAGGVIAGQGEIELIPLIGIVWICAILGDTTSFFIGRRLGREFLMKHGPKLKITPQRLEQVEGYFQRHGGKTILIGRFIGLVRALAPFVAGSSGMAFRRFLPFSVLGTGLWATTFCVLGYIFWRSFDRVAHIAGQAIFGFGLTVAVIFGIVTAYKRRADIRAWLKEHQRHPLLRPLFAVARPVYWRVIRPVAAAVAPQARFVWDRVTPGELGLELTTALAIGAVGFYVFALYAMVLSGDLNATPLDRELLDLGDSARNQVAVDVTKVIAGFGAFPTCAAVLLVALRGAGRAPPAGRAARPPGRVRADLRSGAPGQGGHRPTAPGRASDRRRGLVVSERARRVLHDLDRGCGRAHARPRVGGAGRPGDRRPCARGGDRNVAHLPARALLVGRRGRLGPGRRGVRPARRARHCRRAHAPQ